MIQLNLPNRIEERLKEVMSLYNDDNEFFNAIIDFQLNELKRGIVNIEQDLKQYENKYSITSDDFYKKFTNGKYGDDKDYMIWAGIYEMYVRDKKKLDKLQW